MPCGLSPIPSPHPNFPFYRTIPPPAGTPNVHLSWLDRTSFLRLSSDGMTASTDRGFHSARTNISVREGTWYYEVRIDRGDGAQGKGKGTGGGEVANAHVRVGWGRREAIMDAPVGYDGYSYGLRDTACEKLHLSRRKPYGKDKQHHLSTGDIIGCLITLPERPAEIKKRMQDKSDPAFIKRARAPLHFKGQWYLESKEYKGTREMEALVDREGKLAKEAEEAARLAATAADPSSDDKENNGGGAAGGGGAKVSKGGSGSGKTKQTTNKGKGKGKGKSSDEGQGQAAAETREPTTLAGSSISFFLNGEPIGDSPAFEDLFDFAPPPLAHASSSAHAHENHGGTGGKKHAHASEPAVNKDTLHDDGTLGYYPMVSVYGRGKVTVNFGPEWARPPSSLSFTSPTSASGSSSAVQVRPMCDRWDEFREEERIQDEKEELEWIERIQQDMREEEVKREALLKRKLAADARKEKGKKERESKAGTPVSSSRGGKAKSAHGFSTPRSRLGTSVTPGPASFGLGDTPSSPPSLLQDQMQGDDGGVKMEVDSVVGGGANASSRAPSPSLKAEHGENGNGDEDDAMLGEAGVRDAKKEDGGEDEPTLFPETE